MACPVCGGGVGAGQRFCSACGTRVSVVPPGAPYPAGAPYGAAPPGSPAAMPVSSATRVGSHVQTLGILWCVYGALRLGTGLIGMIVLHALTMHGFGAWGWPFGGATQGFPSRLPPLWLNGLLPVIAVLTLTATALALVTGYALLTRRTWGRTLAIVVGVLTLIKFPLGTALGVYTLWVLAPGESRMEYAALAEGE